MNREDAIEYLQGKGKIRDNEVKTPEFNEREKELIKEVQREGRIWGDPCCEIQ